LNGNTAYDLVVIGSGVAGLSAAASAHELGLSAIVLEKSANLGGGTAFSYGLLWAPRNHLTEAAGYEDSRAAVMTYMRHLSGGIADEKKMAAFVDTVPDVIQFFEKAGMTFQIIHGITDHYYGIAPGGLPEGRLIEAVPMRGGELGAWQARTHLPVSLPYALSAEEMVSWGGMERKATWNAKLMQQRRDDDLRGLGAGLIAQLLRLCVKAEIPIVAPCRARHLVIENGRVAGVQTEGHGFIRATKGVLLATGSYENNASMSVAYEGLPDWQSPFEIDGNDGDGLIMGAEQGGDIHLLCQNMSLQLSYAKEHPTIPNRTVTQIAGIIELSSPHTMVVNRTGRRFADESYFPELVPRIREYDIVAHRHANLPAYLIFDAQFWKTYGVGGHPPGGRIPATIVRANSPGELAQKLEIDAAGLGETLARFNAFAAKGVDDDFSRGTRHWSLGATAPDDHPSTSSGQVVNHRLGTIEQAPFFGVRMYPSGTPSAGLLTDENGRVKHRNGNPIPGLYASGNTTAHTEYGAGYQAGMTLAGGIVFSYRAVREMAAS
jgi:3-oxosteroid 1-dehydrogenase